MGTFMQELDVAKYILSLVNSSIHKEADMPNKNFFVDWEVIYVYAEKNLLIPLLYRRISQQEGIAQDIFIRWKTMAKSSMLLQLERINALNRLLNKAEQQGITLVILKGCVLASLYPEYETRISGDIDIFVYQREKEKAIRLLESLGYRRDINKSNEAVALYIHSFEPSIVELHFSLWESETRSRAGLLESLNLTKEETLVRLNVCGMEMVTLGYLEHLIFQIYHIIKHFSLQGITIRYLADITLYINRYEEFISFKDFWEKVEMLKYDKFCENLFLICIKYLNMSQSIMKDRTLRVSEYEQEFLSDLIQGGSSYEADNESWQLSAIIKPYYQGDRNIPKTGLIRKLNYIKLMYRGFAKKYGKKRKLLLPFAWIYKCVSFVIRCRKSKQKWSKAFQNKLAIVDKRLLLMKSLGLEDGDHGKN
jgi:hypothetical protein